MPSPNTTPATVRNTAATAAAPRCFGTLGFPFDAGAMGYMQTWSRHHRALSVISAPQAPSGSAVSGRSRSSVSSVTVLELIGGLDWQVKQSRHALLKSNSNPSRALFCQGMGALAEAL